MGLFLGFLSCSIGLYFCFCASTILSWWLELCSIIWSQERLIPSAPFFFLKTALAIWGLLCFLMNCEIFCSVKNAVGNLIGIKLNLYIAFGSIVIFTVLILPTQELGISLHLFMLSFISFNSVIIIGVLFFCCLQFGSVTQSCLTLCKHMNGSVTGPPFQHQLLESTQTHVHWVSDVIQPSHPLSSSSPPALNHPQHQDLFKWVISSSHQMAKTLESQLQHQSFQ